MDIPPNTGVRKKVLHRRGPGQPRCHQLSLYKIQREERITEEGNPGLNRSDIFDTDDVL